MPVPKVEPLTPAVMPKHPDIAALINLLAFADDLVIGEGNSYVVLTGRAPTDPSFTFTKTDAGYTVERTK